MKTEQSQLLDRLGKDSGFKVPDGFFDRFNRQVADSLPDVQITDVDRPTTLWVRMRPYLYMAATFAGIWCMMHIFNQFNGTSDQAKRMSEIASGIQLDNHAEELQMSGIVSDYDIYTYEDSVSADIENTPQLP